MKGKERRAERAMGREPGTRRTRHDQAMGTTHYLYCACVSTITITTVHRVSEST